MGISCSHLVRIKLNTKKSFFSNWTELRKVSVIQYTGSCYFLRKNSLPFQVAFLMSCCYFERLCSLGAIETCKIYQCFCCYYFFGKMTVNTLALGNPRFNWCQSCEGEGRGEMGCDTYWYVCIPYCQTNVLIILANTTHFTDLPMMYNHWQGFCRHLHRFSNFQF